MKHTLAAAALFAAAALQAGSISINFCPLANAGDTQPGTPYGLIPVDGANWNAVTTCANVSTGVFPAGTPLKNESGAGSPASAALISHAMYASTGMTGHDVLLRTSVRDYPDSEHKGYPQVKVENIPYARYDVFIYMSNADYPRNTPLTIAFNGGPDSDYYTMSGIQTKTTTNQSEGWGSRTVTALTLGENCIRIPDCTAGSFIVKGYRNDSTRRANICAMQIVERKTLTFTADTSIDAADYAGSTLNLVNEGPVGTQLTFTGPFSASALYFSGNPFSVNLTEPLTPVYAGINTDIMLNVDPFLTDVTTPREFQPLTSPTVKGAASGSAATRPNARFETTAAITSTGITVLARQTLPGAGVNAISLNLAIDGNNDATLANHSGNVGIYPVDASRWMDIAGAGNLGGYPTATVTNILTDSTGAAHPGMSVKICSSGGFWSYGGYSTLAARLLYRYLNDNNSDSQNPGTNYCGVAVTGIPYEKYAVIVYYNSNSTSTTTFASPSINGTCYMGDAALKATVPVSSPTNYWGQCGIPQLLEGVNTLIVTGLNNTDNPDAVICTPSKIVGAKRTSISAVQIVDMSVMDNIQTFRATLPGGPVNFSQIAWEDGATFANGIANTAAITLQADTALTLDLPELTLRNITIVGSGALRLHTPGGAIQVAEWDLGGLNTLEINEDASTYLPAPIAHHPQTTLYTTATTQNLTTAPGQNIELRAGTPEAPATYNVTYAGGAIRVPAGHYIYNTTAGGTTQTSLEFGPQATLKMGPDGTGNISIGKMDALISGGAITAGRFIAAQGLNNPNSPSTILQTGGDITLSHAEGNLVPGSNSQAFILGNWTGSPCTYTMTGGSITVPNGTLNLGNESPATLTLTGGRIQLAGIIGNDKTTRTLNLNGGELALGEHGIATPANSAFTLGGGELTALASCPVTNAFTAADGTTSTLSAAPGATLTFTEPLAGMGNLLTGNPEKDRNGTVAINGGDIAGNITAQSGTLALNGTLTGQRLHRHLRLTVTAWPKTNPNGNLNDINNGLVIAEFILLHNGQPVAWGSGKSAASTPAPMQYYETKNIFDASYTNAYLCKPGASVNEIVITIDRDTTAPFDSYQILAGTNNGRNPTAWTLEGSYDKTVWVPLDSQNIPLSDIVAWTSAGGDPATIGPNQARTFPLAAAQTPTLAIGPGATLTGTGATAHTLALQAGSSLRSTGTPAEALTALGPVTLPAEGTVGALIPEGASHTKKYYILRGPATETLDLDRFTPADGFRIDRDAGGIFLRLRIGTILTLY